MSETAPIVATMRHVRQAQLCAGGLRMWFARYDRALLRRFCRQGLTVDELEALDDEFAQRVAALAREDHRG